MTKPHDCEDLPTPTDEVSDVVGDLLAGGQTGRPPRSDARRNLERLVEAARAAIAEVGIEVSAHEIARRAGVGIGTFYRRVGTREALLHAVLTDMIDKTTLDADKALAHADAWAGFEAFAQHLVWLRTDSRGVASALGGQCGPALDEPLSRLQDRIRRLVERAQTEGSMRTDISWRDVPFFLAAVSTEEATIGLHADNDQWRRNLAVVLDGLRVNRPVR